MREASFAGYRPERTNDGFKALVRRRALVDGGVIVLVSADVGTRIDADPNDHIWSAEGSLSRAGSETVMSTSCDLTLDEAVAKAEAFLVRFAAGDQVH
ncbi:hypothetical protein O9X98_15510 [Agrobacterium salinitolerans]|nr:hypothetical protein [Agrobacterium salinitolerans]